MLVATSRSLMGRIPKLVAWVFKAVTRLLSVATARSLKSPQHILVYIQSLALRTTLKKTDVLDDG